MYQVKAKKGSGLTELLYEQKNKEEAERKLDEEGFLFVKNEDVNKAEIKYGVYRLDTKEEALMVIRDQGRVDRKERLWKVIWYGVWGFFPMMGLIGGWLISRDVVVLPWWLWLILAMVTLAICETKAYLTFQVRYYDTFHAGGKRLPQDLEAKESSNTLALVVAGGLLFIVVALMGKLDVLGAQEWAPLVMLILALAVIFGPILNALGRKPAKAKAEVSIAEEPPEIGIYEIDDAVVFGDVLGPGGRFFSVYNALVRCRPIKRSFPKMDIDIQTTAICQDGSEGILKMALYGELPAYNPFYFFASLKIVGGTAEIIKLLDNPAKRAARKIIGGAEKITDLLTPDAEYSLIALREIIGGGLTEDQIKNILDPSTKSRKYVSLLGFNVNYVTVNVDPSEKQKDRLAKKAEELSDRVGENIQMDTLVGLVKQAARDLKVTPAEAIRISQSERGKITSSTHRLEFDPDQLDSIKEIAAMVSKLDSDQLETLAGFFTKKGGS